ncbi:hypothetical protein [Tenacibaculum aestuarii]|uniref:hypothetical protein n=1 Tax=Tenacibaculum aestuarii TaxID=362781 RepID=UPI0038933726
MYQDLTFSNVVSFLKTFKGDEILFSNSYCGNYIDHSSEIIGVTHSSLRVKVDSMYPNPDCVDKNNETDVSIGSIKSIIHKNNKFKEFEIDGKILSLQAILKLKKKSFDPIEQVKLDKLLEKLNTFYKKILLEGTQTKENVDREINIERYYELFDNLN